MDHPIVRARACEAITDVLAEVVETEGKNILSIRINTFVQIENWNEINHMIRKQLQLNQQQWQHQQHLKT